VISAAALPYAGSSGHSGTDTSKARADLADASGATADRQAAVLDLLGHLGGRGVTVTEVRQRFGWHHGIASSVLSNLHNVGALSRLVEARDRCKVYVLPEHDAGRPVEPFGRRRSTAKVYERGAAAPGHEVRAVVDTWGTLHQHWGKRWRSCKDGKERTWKALAFPVVAATVPNPVLR
jgi:hypothetical protein